MKKIGILLLVLLFLIGLAFVGYKYWALESLKSVTPVNPPTQARVVNPVTVGPKPSVMNEKGEILSHPDNAIYSTNPNK
ncbi:hypothetical protein CSB37_01270 [bacterium DOLZORAL124_38_8]|nr:MAG: hypothetical protein CSB37_01270 [bacterium DOLZORAL124_38_8]